MSLPEEAPSFTEPITEPDILADIETLPTEDDLPCDDGEPMETYRHRQQMQLLIDSLQAHWAERTAYYVCGNMFLHYDPSNRRKFRGLDLFLVMNVENRERKSWVVRQEGMRFPDLIIELLSPMELWKQERQRTKEIQQRAEQERQRAEQERQRADHAEQLLEEYRRRFGKLE